MARMHEKIEYLLEARKEYGVFTPPFATKGLADTQRPIKVRLLDDKREIRPVKFCVYKTPLDDLYYATVRLDGHAYIIKQLRWDWSHGDSTHTHHEDKFWYVWRGPDCHFRGPQFDGPVARSAPRTSMPVRTSSSLAEDDSRTLSDHTIADRSPLGGFPSLTATGTPAGRSVNPRTRAEDQEPENLARAAPALINQAAAEPGIGSSSASGPPNPAGNTAPTLAGVETGGTLVGLARGNSTDWGYLPMRLREARPPDGSPVTMESLFEKITKVFRISNKEFFILQRAFVEGPVNPPESDQGTPKISRQYMISREAEASWDFFMSDLRHQIREHGEQGDWHVRLHAYSA